MHTKHILVLVLLSLAMVVCAVSCSEKTVDERESTGGASTIVHGASNADLAHLKSVWGVDSPDPKALLPKKASDLMVLMTSHDRLQPYEQSIKREWKQVTPDTKIEHELFVVDGSIDTNARYTKWKGDDGKMRYIVLDYSAGTGIVSYFNLAD